MHPGRSTIRLHDGRPALLIGQLDPRVADRWELPADTYIGEVDLASLLAVIAPPMAKMPPRFPAALRDLAFVVDEAARYGDLATEVRGAAKDLLESVTLLDVYRGRQIGAGKKSFALRLVLRSQTGTLTDAEVEKVTGRIEGRVLHKLGGTIRG
jgi:phenylalanyl-tRNA synthetase beta chain